MATFAGMQPHYYCTDLPYSPALFPTQKEVAGSGTHVLTLAAGTDDYHQRNGPSVCYAKLEVPYRENGAKAKAGFPLPPASARWDCEVKMRRPASPMGYSSSKRQKTNHCWWKDTGHGITKFLFTDEDCDIKP